MSLRQISIRTVVWKQRTCFERMSFVITSQDMEWNNYINFKAHDNNERPLLIFNAVGYQFSQIKMDFKIY